MCNIIQKPYTVTLSPYLNIVDLPFNPVTIALLLNPLGEVDVVICPFVKLVKINWWNRAHILGPKLQCLQWFLMEAQDVLSPYDITQFKMATV